MAANKRSSQTGYCLSTHISNPDAGSPDGRPPITKASWEASQSSKEDGNPEFW